MILFPFATQATELAPRDALHTQLHSPGEGQAHSRRTHPQDRDDTPHQRTPFTPRRGNWTMEPACTASLVPPSCFSPDHTWRAAPYDRKGRAPNDSHVPLSRGGRDSALPDAQPPAFTSLRLQQRPGSASQSSLSAPPPWRRASSMHRVMDHPKASAITMAISASETSFNARHASPAAPDPPPGPATSPPPLPLPPRVARDLDVE